jgi:hypothetical protein
VSGNSTGKEGDAESRNHYFGARYYRPVVAPGALTHWPHPFTAVDGETDLTRNPPSGVRWTERLDDFLRNHPQLD